MEMLIAFSFHYYKGCCNEHIYTSILQVCASLHFKHLYKIHFKHLYKINAYKGNCWVTKYEHL